MKKQFLLGIAILLYAPLITAQVLYNDTFDNYTIGNLGTDPTGITPGQGGWLTDMTQSQNNNYVTISSENNKGKVLTMASSTPPLLTNILIKKNGLNTLIDQRTTGNNVIKFEMDYYTGAQHTFSHTGITHQIILGYDPAQFNKHLVTFIYRPETGMITASYYDNLKFIPLKNGSTKGNPSSLPFNTWVTFNVYLDYTNKKIYFETPYFNTVVVGDFLNNSTSTNLMQDYKPSVFTYLFSTSDLTSTHQMVNKLDNIKISALKVVPPNVLSADNFLSESFNLYPNPATDIVNITNSENMLVNQIVIYDINGKQLNTQTFTNEAEIELNVENLASGTYMLHIQTNEATAVKKLVKK